MFKAIISLLIALPELIRLFKAMDKERNYKERKNLVAKDILKIEKAFTDKDAKALNEIFINKEPSNEKTDA